MSKLTVLDLFSGAGGFTLGLEDAKISCIGAIELDRFAAQTFSRNFPHVRLFQRDVAGFASTEVRDLFRGVDIIVAGPPCQGFSVAGPSQYGRIDTRNQLLLEVVRFVRHARPTACIVENVKGFLHGKLPSNMPALCHFMEEMEGLGYSVSHQVLQAADFGVPQWRERVFVFAVRSRSSFPILAGKYGLSRNSWLTVSDAIDDLPLITNGEGSESIAPYDREPTRDYQRLMREGSEGVANHVSMRHTPRLVERFKHIAIGGSLVNVPPEHGQRVRNGQELDVRKRFKMNNQRLDPHKVSLAITASFQSNFVHPFLHRNLTAREGARLQSFPDWFIFQGPRTLMSKPLLVRERRYDEIGLSQYNQIGNAVPPLLARAIGEVAKQFLGN